MMQRTKSDIYALIEKGETFHLECKKAQGGLPGSLWESYSAFCNTDGGVILLGVKELEDKHFEVVGVNDTAKLVQDFTNTLNDSNKVSVNVLTDKDVQIIDCDGKTVIAIGTLRMPLEDAYKGWKSDCRNKGLQKMFQFLGYSEKAGSGFPKIFMGTDEQHWARPFLQEDFKFDQTTLTMPTVDLTETQDDKEHDSTLKSGLKSTLKTLLKSTLNPTDTKIVKSIVENPKITITEMQKVVGLTRDGVNKSMKRLKATGVIRRVGPDKGGHWEIVK